MFTCEGSDYISLISLVKSEDPFKTQLMLSWCKINLVLCSFDNQNSLMPQNVLMLLQIFVISSYFI